MEKHQRNESPRLGIEVQVIVERNTRLFFAEGRNFDEGKWETYYVYCCTVAPLLLLCGRLTDTYGLHFVSRQQPLLFVGMMTGSDVMRRTRAILSSAREDLGTSYTREASSKVC